MAYNHQLVKCKFFHIIILRAQQWTFFFSLPLVRTFELNREREKERERKKGEQQALSYFCIAVLHHHCLVSFFFSFSLDNLCPEQRSSCKLELFFPHISNDLFHRFLSQLNIDISFDDYPSKFSYSRPVLRPFDDDPIDFL